MCRRQGRMRMAKRRWLITGVSSGLGKALLGAEVAHGDVVAGTVRGMSDENPYADHGPGSGRLFSLDATKPHSIASGVAEALEWVDGVDVVVHNADRKSTRMNSSHYCASGI